MTSVGEIIGGNYLVGSVIAERKAEKLYTGICKQSSRHVLLRFVNRDVLQKHQELQKLLDNEISVMSVLNHSKLLKMVELVQDQGHTVLVTEWADNDLLCYVQKHGKLSELSAFKLFKEIVAGIEYMHDDVAMCHRDLHPLHILLDTSIKISYFGRACNIEGVQPNEPPIPNDLLSWQCRCPEARDGQTYDGELADVWSLGCILFFMLTGKYPFEGDTVEQLQANQEKGVNLSDPLLAHVTKDGKDLLGKLLDVNSATRLTVPEMKLHEWWNRMNIAALIQGSPRRESLFNNRTLVCGSPSFFKFTPVVPDEHSHSYAYQELLRTTKIERVLGSRHNRTQTALLATFGEQQQHCNRTVIILLDKYIWPCQDIPALTNLVQNATVVQAKPAASPNIHYGLFTSTAIDKNLMKITIIDPATDILIARYSTGIEDEQTVLVEETKQMYEQMNAQYLKRQSILPNMLKNHGQLGAVTVAEDEQVIITYGSNTEKLVAYVKDETLNDMRQLRQVHIPLLKHIMEKAFALMEAKFAVPKNKVRAYIEYPPEQLPLQVHFCRASFKPEGDRAYLLQEIIANLQASDTYYESKTFYYASM